MKYTREGRIIICRLEKGDEICAAMIGLQEKESISAACISGIGATNDCTVGVFEIAKGAYEPVHLTGDMEITSLTGNMTRMGGKPYVHLHISCAKAGGAVTGGHLLSGVISLTGEIFITVTDAVIERARDEALGINLMQV
ncbi:MAG: DNA-binding protein [Clostridiales bacterium]|nr:DNA-binding protein [Clostridiales bacterium]